MDPRGSFGLKMGVLDLPVMALVTRVVPKMRIKVILASYRGPAAKQEGGQGPYGELPSTCIFLRP